MDSQFNGRTADRVKFLEGRYILKTQKKFCEICGKEFQTKNYGNSRRYCFDCSPQVTDNFTRADNIVVKRRAIKRQLVKEAGGKCQKCGYNASIRALQFHHLDPEEKDFTVSTNITRGMNELREEVKKCVLLCSNCHVEEHERLSNEGYNQFNSDI